MDMFCGLCVEEFSGVLKTPRGEDALSYPMTLTSFPTQASPPPPQNYVHTCSVSVTPSLSTSKPTVSAPAS